MALNYNITDILNINNANTSIDALSAETVDSTAYDAAFHFTGNFLSGNFIQDTADIESALSNLSIDQNGLNAAHSFLIDSAAISGTGGRTSYGSAASAQKALRVTNTTYTKVNVGGTAQDISSFVDVNGSDAIPMIPQSGNLPTGNELVAADTDFGTGLMNAVSQALFKRLGKNAAINNDNSLRTDLMNKFYTALNDSVSESNVAYASSKFFKRYLDSGRYGDHNEQLVNQLKTYTVDNTMFKMIVKISGSVLDSDGPDLSVAANSTRIFGTPDSDTLVNEGEYETHVFVALRHKDTV